MLRALVASVLVPLMVLMVAVTPREAHACGGEEGMSDCPCAVVDADVPQLRRLPCCEPEPEARPTPAAALPEVEGEAVIAVLGPITTVVSLPRARPQAAPVVWPRGPPRPGPLYLRHCSLLR